MDKAFSAVCSARIYRTQQWLSKTVTLVDKTSVPITTVQREKKNNCIHTDWLEPMPLWLFNFLISSYINIPRWREKPNKVEGTV